MQLSLWTPGGPRVLEVSRVEGGPNGQLALLAFDGRPEDVDLSCVRSWECVGSALCVSVDGLRPRDVRDYFVPEDVPGMWSLNITNAVHVRMADGLSFRVKCANGIVLPLVPRSIDGFTIQAKGSATTLGLNAAADREGAS